MRHTLLWRLCLALLPCLLQGCLVESLPEEPSRLQIGVGLPALRQPLQAFNPWDSQDLFLLEKFPKLVRVSVVSKDFVLASATWPDRERGIGEGEGPGGEVNIELEVAAGSSRRLRALGYVVLGGEVLVYQEQQALELDLIAGKSEEAALTMTRHPSGTVELTARCEEGNMGVWNPTEVSLVDATAFVVHPPRRLERTLIGSLQVLLENVPLGRPHWVRISLSDGQRFMIADQRMPTFSVSKSGETRLVEVVLPCQALAK